MIKVSTLFSFFLIIAFALSGVCQDSDSIKNRVNVSGFPIVYYTPETGLAGGALGLLNWNWKSDSIHAKSSSTTLGFAYTLQKQVLFYLPFNLFLKNDAFRLNGEIGFYKYVYFYFGQGNTTGSFEDKKEQFDISFPRFRLTGLAKVRPNLFVGARYAFDYYYGLEIEQGGLIDVNRPEGVFAGVNSGLGPALLFDTRSSVFYPRSGFLLDYSNTIDLGGLISDYKYTRNVLDISYFISPLKKSVVGFNMNMQSNSGDVPFYQLSLLGGSKRLRGQFEGEFRDNIALQSQIEWRQEVLKNWGLTAFVGLGYVADGFKSLQIKNHKLGSGVGVRYKLNKKDHVNIRLDVGFGNGKVYPYITIGEAF